MIEFNFLYVLKVWDSIFISIEQFEVFTIKISFSFRFILIAIILPTLLFQQLLILIIFAFEDELALSFVNPIVFWLALGQA